MTQPISARPAPGDEAPAKRSKPSPPDEDLPFHPTLLVPSNVAALAAAHAASTPYKHAVVNQLFDPAFLHKARKEIVEQISFREKETDICASSLAGPSSLADFSLRADRVRP